MSVRSVSQANVLGQSVILVSLSVSSDSQIIYIGQSFRLVSQVSKLCNSGQRTLAHRLMTHISETCRSHGRRPLYAGLLGDRNIDR